MTYYLDNLCAFVGIIHRDFDVYLACWALLYSLEKWNEFGVLRNYVITFVAVDSMPPDYALPF